MSIVVQKAVGLDMCLIAWLIRCSLLRISDQSFSQDKTYYQILIIWEKIVTRDSLVMLEVEPPSTEMGMQWLDPALCTEVGG